MILFLLACVALAANENANFTGCLDPNDLKPNVDHEIMIQIATGNNPDFTKNSATDGRYYNLKVVGKSLLLDDEQSENDKPQMFKIYKRQNQDTFRIQTKDGTYLGKQKYGYWNAVYGIDALPKPEKLDDASFMFQYYNDTHSLDVDSSWVYIDTINGEQVIRVDEYDEKEVGAFVCFKKENKALNDAKKFGNILGEGVKQLVAGTVKPYCEPLADLIEHPENIDKFNEDMLKNTQKCVNKAVELGIDKMEGGIKKFGGEAKTPEEGVELLAGLADKFGTKIKKTKDVKSEKKETQNVRKDQFGDDGTEVIEGNVVTSVISKSSTAGDVKSNVDATEKGDNVGGLGKSTQGHSGAQSTFVLTVFALLLLIN